MTGDLEELTPQKKGKNRDVSYKIIKWSRSCNIGSGLDFMWRRGFTYCNVFDFLYRNDGTLSNWQIQIDSNLCEIYLKHKTDKTKIISLNKFNDNQSFLSLANCNFVDYSKPFPTLITAISGTALENTVFNKLSVGTSAQNYRLKNVDVKWKHTYL